MASSDQLAGCMDKYQKRNELPESEMNKTCGYFPHFFFYFNGTGHHATLASFAQGSATFFCTWGQSLTEYMNGSTKSPRVLILHLWRGKSRWDPTKGEVINKQKKKEEKKEKENGKKRIDVMPLAVVVLDKRKPARSQLETAPNKFGPEPGQLETPARQAQVEGSYVLIFHPHIWSWEVSWTGQEKLIIGVENKD